MTRQHRVHSSVTRIYEQWLTVAYQSKLFQGRHDNYVVFANFSYHLRTARAYDFLNLSCTAAIMKYSYTHSERRLGRADGGAR